MTPDEYCQQRAAASGSSFYYSFLFLEPRRRRAITALYAFCREVDDVVDECPDPGLARVYLRAEDPDLEERFAGCFEIGAETGAPPLVVERIAPLAPGGPAVSA